MFLISGCLSVRIWHFRPKKPPSTTGAALPGVSILRPLRGVDDHLEQNLESAFELEYPKFEIILSVADDTDPAIEIARRVMARHPDIPSTLIIGTGTDS